MPQQPYNRKNHLQHLNFCKFTLWMPPVLDARGRLPVRPSPFARQWIWDNTQLGPDLQWGQRGLSSDPPGKRGPAFLPKKFKIMLKQLATLSHKLYKCQHLTRLFNLSVISINQSTAVYFCFCPEEAHLNRWAKRRLTIK